MRILYVSTIFPYPAYRGGKLRISNLIARLSEQHEVHLISLCSEYTDDLDALREQAEETCSGVTVVPHRRRYWRGGLRSLLYREPYEVGLHHNERMERAVGQAVEDVRPDLLWCSRLASLQYLPNNLSSTILLDQHDLASRLWEIMKERGEKWWIRQCARFNHALVTRYQNEVYEEVDICVSVSEEERRLTQAFAPGSTRLLVAPNGVDVAYFSPSNEVAEEEGALVSVGSMDQARNVDASRYFVEEVLPLLREQGFDVTYYIVGQNPTEEVKAMEEHTDVVVTGTVDDVRPFLERSSVVVAPYRMGSGVKHKVPIAFSMGKPVVATPNACHGIDVTDGEEVMIAEDPRTFANSIRELLESDEKRQTMGERARAFIREEYSWDVIARRLIADVEGALRERVSSASAPSNGKRPARSEHSTNRTDD